MNRTLIFDMDDTLMPCGRFYAESLQAFSKFSSERTGLPIEICRKMVNSIDMVCIELPDGWTKDRFPRSFAAASVALDVIQGNVPNPDAAEHSYDIGDSVFSAPYDLYPGVRDMLIGYKNKGYNMLLCTKGDLVVQQQKIDRNKLEDIFPRENICIVGKKSPEILREIIQSRDLAIHDCTYIGDSLRDDIGCANALGMDNVWVAGSHNNKWAYESVQVTPTYTIPEITDLPNIIFLHQPVES